MKQSACVPALKIPIQLREQSQTKISEAKHEKITKFIIHTLESSFRNADVCLFNFRLLLRDLGGLRELRPLVNVQILRTIKISLFSSSVSLYKKNTYNLSFWQKN